MTIVTELSQNCASDCGRLWGFTLKFPLRRCRKKLNKSKKDKQKTNKDKLLQAVLERKKMTA